MFFCSWLQSRAPYKCLWHVLILFESIDKVSGTSNDGNATKNIYFYTYLCIYPFAFICIYSFACCFFNGTLLVDLSRRILARGTKDMVTINV